MTSAIAQLNDEYRKGFCPNLTLTNSIAALPRDEVMAIVKRVKEFDNFEDGDDPYHERDFGAFDHGTRKVFWQISYYDRNLEYGSDNPADPAVTTRVMTIMFAEDY